MRNARGVFFHVHFRETFSQAQPVNLVPASGHPWVRTFTLVVTAEQLNCTRLSAWQTCHADFQESAAVRACMFSLHGRRKKQALRHPVAQRLPPMIHACPVKHGSFFSIILLLGREPETHPFSLIYLPETSLRFSSAIVVTGILEPRPSVWMMVAMNFKQQPWRELSPSEAILRSTTVAFLVLVISVAFRPENQVISPIFIRGGGQLEERIAIHCANRLEMQMLFDQTFSRPYLTTSMCQQVLHTAQDLIDALIQVWEDFLQDVGS